MGRLATYNIQIAIPTFVVVIAFLFSGCSLIYEHDECPVASYNGNFHIDVNWEYALDAMPEGMAYMFFPIEGDDVWRFDIPGRNGGDIEIRDDDYRVVCMNDDTSGILFKDEDSFYFTCYCRTGGLYDGLGGTLDNPIGPAVADNGESVEVCPDMMWCGSVWEMDLNALGEWITYNEGEDNVLQDIRGITLYPRPAVANYRFIIENVSNLSGVKRLCASISGMASEMCPATLMCGSRCATLPLKADAAGDDCIEGRFLTFGLPKSPESANILTLYVWLNDGKKLRYDFDVTKQARNAKDPMNVSLIVGGIELPPSDPVGGEGGLDVSIDGWITEIIDIQS